MGHVCCDRQNFERHPDPAIADIGHGGGAEYVVGNCLSCGAILISCWVAGGISAGLEVVSQELIDTFLGAPDWKSRKKLLSDWFNELP